MQKKYRLTQNSSFSYIYKKGTSYATSLLVLYKLKASSIKIGVSVGKKVGNSVVRSKVKRRIKESFREKIPLMKEKYNFIIIARSGCKEASYQDINKQLLILLDKANIPLIEVVDEVDS